MNSIRLSTQLFTAVISGSLLSCAPSHSADSAPPLPTVTQPVADSQAIAAPVGNSHHSIQNAQLKGLMKLISARTQGNWPKGVPQDPEDSNSAELNKQLDSAALLADGLADAAVHIPTSAAESKMSEAGRAGFEAQANILHAQAIRLGEAARGRKVEQMQQTLDGIGETCISCHSRYRDFSGPLSLPLTPAQ